MGEIVFGGMYEFKSFAAKIPNLSRAGDFTKDSKERGLNSNLSRVWLELGFD